MALYRYVCKAQRLMQPNIVQCDALSGALPRAATYDVVLSNPPYRKLAAAELGKLPETYRYLVNGQPNLYALFVDLSLRLATPAGAIGLLTPASFFSGRSFGALRSLLARKSIVTQVDFIEPRTGVFLNVEQETAISLLRKNCHRNTRTAVSVTSDGQSYKTLGKFSAQRNSTGPWVLPRSHNDLAAMAYFNSSGWRLEDYGYAPKTGYLVPHRMPVPRMKTPGTGPQVYPLIWATQIGKDGAHHFRAGCADDESIYVDVAEFGAVGVLRTPSVALQRISSKDQARRLRCAPIMDRARGWLREHGQILEEEV